MKYKFYLIIFVCIINFQCFGEGVKIEEILDTNIFYLASGDTIKLGYIECPSVKDTSYKDILISKKIINYLNDIVIGQPITLDQILDTDKSTGILWVNFPLTKLNLNLEYIKQGWAKYISDTTFIFNEEFSSANNVSQRRNKIIWKDIEKIRRSIVKPKKYLYASYGRFYDSSGDYFSSNYNEYYSIAYGPQFMTPGCGYELILIRTDHGDDVEETLFLNTHHSIIGKYIALDIGAIFVNQNFFDTPLPIFLFYSDIKVGLIKYIYFSLDFAIVYPVQYGIGTQIYKPLVHLFVGKSTGRFGFNQTWARLDISFNEKLIFKVNYLRINALEANSLICSVGYKL